MGEQLNASRPLPSEIVVRNDRRKALIILIIGVLLLFIAGMLLMYPNLIRLNPWWFALFGAITLLGAIWGMVDTRPRLVIDREGIRDRIAGHGLIRWEQVLDARLLSNGYYQFLCVRVRDKRALETTLMRLIGGLAPKPPDLAMDEIAMILSVVKDGPEDMLASVKEWMEIQQR